MKSKYKSFSSISVGVVELVSLNPCIGLMLGKHSNLLALYYSLYAYYEGSNNLKYGSFNFSNYEEFNYFQL